MNAESHQPSREPSEPAFGSDDARETPDIHHLHAPILREQAEPRDGREPVPLWLTVLYGLVVFWGGFYLASYSGGFRPDVYDENRPTGEANNQPSEPDPAVQGQRLFTMNLAACHQLSGQGVAGQFPPLAGSEWVTGEPAILIRILLHGLQGPVSVKGETYNGNMPAFGERLDDQKLSLVLTYIRQSWGNQAEPISPEWIAQVRTAETGRQQPWTVDGLKQVTPEPPPAPAAQDSKPADSKPAKPSEETAPANQKPGTEK